MPIKEMLDTLEASGRLKRWTPDLDRDEVPLRALYLRPLAHAWLTPFPTASRPTRRLAASAREFLKGFIRGDFFDDPEKFKNLDVDDLHQADRGVYSFRVTRPPQERLLGGFCYANTFIATHNYLRSEMPPGDWTAEKDEVLRVWAAEFRGIHSEDGAERAFRLPAPLLRGRLQLTNVS